MVKKLLRHECAALGRVLLPTYSILLIIAVFTRILQFVQSDNTLYNIVFGSTVVFLVIAAFVCLMMTIVMGVVRYYRNLFTAEGYLSFTLPISPAQHLLVKLCSTMLFGVLSVVAILLAAAIATAGELLAELVKAGVYLLNQIPVEASGHVALYAVEFLFAVLAAQTFTVLIYYTCITIGQLARKNRILLAVGVYFIYYTATQVISTIAMVILSLFGDALLEPIVTFAEAHPYAAMHLLLCGITLVTLALCAVLFFVCHRIMTRRLNLE